jgi:hypothetical protein
MTINVAYCFDENNDLAHGSTFANMSLVAAKFVMAKFVMAKFVMAKFVMAKSYLGSHNARL